MGYKYKICLLNVEFDDTYNNVLYFKNASDIFYYFSEQYGASFDNTPLVNFNVNDGLTAEVVFNSTANISILQKVNRNYCIIKEEREEEDPKYFYYFIKECKYVTGSQIKLKLKLDVFNTYPITQWIDSVPEVEVQRAHLNRFNKSSKLDGYYEFNTASDSLMHIKEDMTFNKRMVKYWPTIFYDNSKEYLLNEWFNKAIAYWVIIFVNPNYKDSTNDINHQLGMSVVTLKTGTYQILYYPVLNDEYRMQYRLTTAGQYQDIGRCVDNYQYSDFNNLLNCEDTLSANIIDIRACKIPFWFFMSTNTTNIDYSINDKTLEITLLNSITYDSNNNPNIPFFGYYVQSTQKGTTTKQVRAFYMSGINSTDSANAQNLHFPTYSQDIFTSTNIDYRLLDGLLDPKDIKQYSNKASYNPKTYSSTITDAIITYGQNQFTYDLLALGTTKLTLNYYEVLGPSIVRSYIYVDPKGLYDSDSRYNFIGIVASNNFSLTYFTDKLAEYIANNKNAWLQTTFKIASNVATSTIKGGIKGAEKTGAEGAIAGAGIGLVKSGISAINSAVQYNLNIDNLKSAPDSISNIQGDFTLLTNVTNLDIGLELWRALDTDIKTFNDYCLRFGYKVNRMGKLADYINIRKYWNYIQAYVEILPDRFNAKVAEEIKDAFDRGIRFWTVEDIYDTVQFDYSLPNYERYFDE